MRKRTKIVAPIPAAASSSARAALVAGPGDSITYRPASWFRRTCRSGLMGGANDIRHGATTAQIVARLKRIVNAAQAFGVVVVISTVPPQNLHAAALLALNRAIRRYAAAADVLLLDMYATVGTAAGTYRAGRSDDGLHPNRTGFARMATVAERQLPALLATAGAADRPERPPTDG